MQEHDSLRGKTALVTGGAKRLGKAIALALAQNGMNIVLHYNRSENEAGQTAEKIRAAGVGVTLHRADLSVPGEAERMFREHREMNIGVLVNNASSFGEDDIFSFSLEDLSRHIAVNAYAPLVLSRAFALTGGNGSIIHILDTRIASFDPKHASYHLSKRMLYTMTRMMAMEFAPRVRVNGIAPGIVLPPEGEDAAYVSRVASQYPLKKSATPGDVAAAVIFILESGAMTGQVIYLDGGSHLQGCAYGM